MFNTLPYDHEYFNRIYAKIAAGTSSYLKNLALYLVLWVTAYLIVCCLVYRHYAKKATTRNRGPMGARRVLVVVAHPDDECMFFGPTIYRLCQQGVDVHLLCLSDGNFEGKGDIRTTELWEACKELGVAESNICLVKDSRLKDDPKCQWPVPVVAKLIHHRLEALDISALVTFDKDGVSAHPNHSAVFLAVAYMFVEKMMPNRCTVYTLDSVNVIRKYLGFLDLPLSYMLSSKKFFLRMAETRRIVRAMQKHQSQMVWFRYLYVSFSRYMVINTLRKISLDDIELELEVDD